MNRADLAWLACAIDAEGTISIGVRGSEGGSHYWYVSVVNTNRQFIEKVARLMKTSVTARRPSPPFGKLTIFNARFSRRQAVLEMLLRLRPHFIIKANVADKAIAELNFALSAAGQELRRKRMSMAQKKAWSNPITRKNRVEGIRRARKEEV